MSLGGLAWAVAACGGDPISPLTPADVVGTYALVSINGGSLPAPYGQGTTVVYDTLVLMHDSTYAERDGGGNLGSRVVTDSGTYAGRWALNAAGTRLLTTSDVGHGVVDTLTFTVVNRGASLTINVPAITNPPLPGGGLWVYSRVR